MRRESAKFRPPRRPLLAIVLALVSLAAAAGVAQVDGATVRAGAQSGAPEQAVPPPATQPALADGRPLDREQEAILERVKRLENRLVKLAAELAESDPEKAERLRMASARAGEEQIRRRIERLVRLLQDQQFGDAERAQQELLADLDSILALLAGGGDDLQQRRAEREELERRRGVLRSLFDEQAQHLRATQGLRAAESRSPDSAPATDGADSSPEAEQVAALEQAQRATRERAAELEKELRPTRDDLPPDPGLEPLERAGDYMRRAADRLHERGLEQAEEWQQKALEHLQRALDELEDALRQVRREEMEETLAALEQRFRYLLEGERQVRAGVDELQRAKATASANTPDPDGDAAGELLRVAAQQHELVEQCRSAQVILIEEGTTVVLPALAAQILADMEDVAQRLDKADVAAVTQRRLDDVIRLLEQIVAAVERKRREEQEAAAAEGNRDAPATDAMLPPSAELKLLRSQQVAVNERTRALGEEQGPERTPEQIAELERLAERQQELSELTRRMAEEK